MLIKAQRQSANALNFGLLYGMGADKLWKMGITDYGLAWTLDQAAAAKEALLYMYPDIACNQIFEGIHKKVYISIECYSRNKYTNESESTSIKVI